jgi:hypothetical protein
MKREKMVSIYFTKEEHEALMKHINKNTNGFSPSVSTYVRSVILKMINSEKPTETAPPIAPTENKPEVKSNQTLNLGDLFNL